jgi:hypothetical protein
MPGPDRFVRVPTELLDALLHTPMNGTQWRILFWVIRRTLGWNRDLTLFSWYQIARDLGLDRGGVVRTGNRLTQAGVLSAVGNQIGVGHDPTLWERSRLAPQGSVMTDVNADDCHRKPMTEIIGSDGNRHRKRGQESSLFRRAKDSSKDRLKTCKDMHSRKPQDRHHDPATTDNVERRLLAGAAKPIPGKYDRISQN